MKSCNESILSGHIGEDLPSHIDKSRLFLPLISKNNHTLMEIRLPRSKLNGHLKQILREPKEQYKKIDRSIGRSLSYLGKSKANEDAFKIKILQSSRELTPSAVNTLTVKSQITKILNSYESSLLDHKQAHFQKRFKRPLIDKKLVNLLPEIAECKKRKEGYISIVDRYSQIADYNYSLNTIEYPSYEVIDRQQSEVEPPPDKITKRKKKQYRSLTLEPRKGPKKLKRLKDEQYNQLQQQEKYEPWKLQSEQNQDLF